MNQSKIMTIQIKFFFSIIFANVIFTKKRDNLLEIFDQKKN